MCIRDSLLTMAGPLHPLPFSVFRPLGRTSWCVHSFRSMVSPSISGYFCSILTGFLMWVVISLLRPVLMSLSHLPASITKILICIIFHWTPPTFPHRISSVRFPSIVCSSHALSSLLHITPSAVHIQLVWTSANLPVSNILENV